MPANTPLGNPYPLPTEPVAEGAQAIRNLAEAVAHLPPLVTALPASPVDKQEIYFLADATAGIIWHLRYRAASPNPEKWERVGGPPLYGAIQPQSAITNVNYETSGVVGPDLPTPLSGVYDVHFGCNAYNMHTAVQAVYASFARGATEALDTDAIISTLAANGGPGRDGAARLVRTVLVAGSPVRYRARCTAGGSAYITDRWITSLPVRVG
jgi:hypothetical protein